MSSWWPKNDTFETERTRQTDQPRVDEKKKKSPNREKRRNINSKTHEYHNTM